MFVVFLFHVCIRNTWLFYFKSPSKLSLTHSETQTHTFCLFLSFSFLTFALMEPESLATHVRGIWIQNLLFHANMFYQLNLNHLATSHNFFSVSFSFKNIFLLLRFLEQIPWSERGVPISFIIFIYHMIRDTFFICWYQGNQPCMCCRKMS